MKLKVLQLVMAELGFGVHGAPEPTHLTDHHLSSKLFLCVHHYIMHPLKVEMCVHLVLQVGFLIFLMAGYNNCLLNQFILIEESTEHSPN